MAVHKIAAIKYNTTVLPATGSINPGISEFMDGPESQLYNRLVAVNRYMPVARFTVRDVAAGLAIVGASGLQINAVPLELYSISGADGAKLATTGQKWNMTKGIVVPSELVLQDGAFAELAYEASLGSSAGTAPYSVTAAQTVPAVTYNAAYTQGAVTLNGSDIGPVQSTRIAFGWVIRQIFGDGKAWPLLVYGPRMQPVITIETLSDAVAALVDVTGTTNAISIVCQRLGTVSRAGSGDLTITCSQQLVTLDSVAGSRDGEARTIIRCTPSSDDGSEVPITIAS
jgi:hypothetical protein